MGIDEKQADYNLSEDINSEELEIANSLDKQEQEKLRQILLKPVGIKDKYYYGDDDIKVQDWQGNLIPIPKNTFERLSKGRGFVTQADLIKFNDWMVEGRFMNHLLMYGLIKPVVKVCDIGKGLWDKLQQSRYDGSRFKDSFPKNWSRRPNLNGKGARYIDPKGKNDNYIRFSPKNSHPKAPIGQREPYFVRMKNGKYLTKNGEWVIGDKSNRELWHIPQRLFKKVEHLLDLK